MCIRDRYKHGRKDMDSLFGGLWSMNCTLMIGTIWMGFVSLFKPCLQVAMSVTMMVQAWGCFYLSIEMCKTRLEMSIAGITAIFLATKGATWGLCVGLGLCLIMGAFKNAKYEEETMGTESPEDVLTEEVVPDVLATIAEEEL